jgi:hypothetical protein
MSIVADWQIEVLSKAGEQQIALVTAAEATVSQPIY